MRRSGVTEVLFGLFLGVLLTGFLYVLMITVNPAPSHDQPGYFDWPIYAATFMVASATLIMIVSLTIPARMQVIANGLLFGGLYTMIIGVAYAVWQERSAPRLVLMLAALVVSVVVGYVRFAKRHPEPDAASAEVGPLADRVTDIEARLRSISDALR